VSIPGYPGGIIPKSMAPRLCLQDITINLWPDELVGWKVGYVPPQHQERLGATMAGCIFRKNLSDAARPRPSGHARRLTPFKAEFIVRLGKDAPAGRTEWTAKRPPTMWAN